MLKAELHSHTGDDPLDPIPYDTPALIDRAAALGYRVLAVTLHDRQLDLRPFDEYARARGVVLIPGIERTLRGKHVLLLNFPEAAEDVDSFDDVRRLKARANGVVIAPHPFFPTSTCLGAELDRHADLFDAVEFNAFYTRTANFNKAACRWAAAHGKPVVGNGDVHRLSQLGATFSLIDAAPSREAVCDAIRAGRVIVRSRPLSHIEAATYLASLVAADVAKRLFVRPQPAVGDAA